MAGAQVERRREQPEVGDIHVPVAVDVAEEAEQALGVAEGVVVAGVPSPLPSSCWPLALIWLASAVSV